MMTPERARTHRGARVTRGGVADRDDERGGGHRVADRRRNGASGGRDTLARAGPPVDLDALAGLGDLEVLVLQHHPIRDLAPLVALPRLRVLDLAFAPVDDLDPLAGLTGLRERHLRATLVSDLAPVVGMDGLEVLDVAHTRVADLAPLHGPPRLPEIDVEGAPVVAGTVAALAAAVPGVHVVT
jgi:hypothetical protein